MKNTFVISKVIRFENLILKSKANKVENPPWETPLDGRQARSFSCVQRSCDHHLQLLHVVVVVEQGVLVVDLEVLEAESDETFPEVVLDGEHAVLGPAVDCRVAEG